MPLMRRIGRGVRSCACVVFALVAMHAPRAAAQSAPTSATGRYSPYEQEAVDAALRQAGTHVDPSPEGKIVESIEIVTLDVIEERDPAPVAIDVVHTVTRREVVARELLVRAGDRYTKVLADESARNLRRLPQLSVVLCVAARGSTPDRVRLFVITKDVWSLLLDFDFSFTPGGLESLILEPKESNIAGSHDGLLARLTLTPDTYALGAAYAIPRLAGRWLSLSADMNVIVNRHTGDAEGSIGTVTIARPLYSTRTDWSWFSGVAWRDEVYRRYVNAAVATYDASASAGGGQVPWAYRARRITQQASVLRSFGWANKNDFVLGAEMSHKVFRMPDVPGSDPAAVAEFVRTQLPVGETRVGPYVQWRGYTTNHLRILDFDTLGLQEDYPLGHDLVARAYPVLGALGSSRTFVGAYLAAQYTVALGDGLARAAIESTTEMEAERVSDASTSASVTVVSPRTGIGRLVFAATAVDRWRNYLNVKSYLGGDTRLRGYPSRFLVGQDLFAMNLEYRTRPITLTSVHVGAAAFYDVGDAFDSFDAVHPKHSVGFGLRLLFPQIDRVALRFDVGFPIVAGALPAGLSPVSFFFAFHQALALDSGGTTAVSSATSATPTVGGGLGD